jgi:hypothetical protein
MPDGTVIPDVPDGTTQEDLWERYQGYLASKKPTPIESALQKRDEQVADYQANLQHDYETRRAQIEQMDKEHPEFAPPQWIREDAPAVAPNLTQREPVLPTSPVQKFGTAAKMGFVDDIDTKRRIMAASLFPGDPQGINRVGFLGGVPVYTDDNGDLQQLTSGATRFGASELAHAPETAGAIAGSFAGPWWGAPVGAMATHAAKRYIAGKIFGEPLDPVGLGVSTAAEGASTFVGEGIGRGIAAVGNRGRFIDMSPGELQMAQAFQKRMKDEFGIDLDLAQASGNRRLIGYRGFAARSPTKAADKFQAHDERAAAQFEDATRNFFATIANETPADVAGMGATNAAKSAIAGAKKKVSNMTDPDYTAAYAKAPIVTDPKIIQFFRHKEFREAWRLGQDIMRLENKDLPTVTVRTPVPNMTMNARAQPTMGVRVGPRGAAPVQKPPGISGTPRPALTYEAEPVTPGTSVVPAQDEAGALTIPGATPKYSRVKTPGGFYRTVPQYTEETFPVPDLRSLDYTKQGLDAMIDHLFESGKGKLAGALQQQKKAFVETLDNLANPEYQAARAKYKKLYAQHVAPLENGPVGVLASIKDPDAATAAAKIFGDADVSSAQIAATRKAIEAEKEGPQKWNNLVRSWLAFNLNAAKHETQTGVELNVAGKFRNRLYSDPAQRARMDEMLPPDAANVFGRLMESAQALGRTPVAGSVTRHDTEMANALKGTGAATFKWLTTPRRRVIDVAEQAALERGTLKIADALLDPAKIGHLKRVIRMRPSTHRALLISAIVGAEATPRALQSAFPDERNNAGPFAH